ncbi:MAG TPA: SPOR domain-containing protein, partial [Thermoanaerobaculia bacterium]|nr:SPOR domain-containing protein [Thermoanaerobaculia bacterium]
ASASRRDTFNAYKLIHALATLGILTRVGSAGTTAAPEPQFSLDDFASAGVADAADMFGEATPAPVVAPTPQFDFDEAEALKQPTLEVSLGAAGAAAAATSAWDEPDEVPEPAPTVRTPMWSVPPQPSAVPIPAATEPPVDADEEQWGFDEAQIETAQRAATPAPTPKERAKTPPPPRNERRYGLLLALMVIFILAAAGYFGLRWYQSRDEKLVADVPVRRPAPRPRPAAATPAVTPTPLTATQPVEATLTIATPTETVPPTTTIAPKAPMQVTAVAPAPIPETASAQAPLPLVVPKQGPNRFQTMAREFAAHPAGKYTVQIQILCEASNLDKAILTGGSFVWFVPQTIGSRSCYRVFWGHYETRDEAQKALASVPASLRDKTSAVKPVPKPQ